MVTPSFVLQGGAGQGGRVLSPDSVRRMMTDHITPAQKATSPCFPGFWDNHGWGYGGDVTTGIAAGLGQPGSYGWMDGFGTGMLIDPSIAMTTIVLTQRLMRGLEDAATVSEVISAALAGLQ